MAVWNGSPVESAQAQRGAVGRRLAAVALVLLLGAWGAERPAHADAAPTCSSHPATWLTVQGAWLPRAQASPGVSPSPSASAQPPAAAVAPGPSPASPTGTGGDSASTSQVAPLTCSFVVQRADRTEVLVLDGPVVAAFHPQGAAGVPVQVIAQGELVAYGSGKALKVELLRVVGQAVRYPLHARCGCCGCRVYIQSPQELSTKCTSCTCGKLLETCVGP